MDKTDRLLKTLTPKVEVRTPIATDLFLPNHSGDHSAGHTGTPVNDLDIANKKYVDDNIGTPYTDADAVAAIKGDADWNASNWDTAYGWGDWSGEGFVNAAGAVSAVATADNYLKNDANDSTSGTITAAGFTSAAGHLTLTSGNITDGTNSLTVANAKTAYDHSQDNTQAHSDYLLNSGADVAVGPLTITADNSTADQAYVPMVLYNTDATPPAASGFPIGTIYIQYTA